MSNVSTIWTVVGSITYTLQLMSGVNHASARSKIVLPVRLPVIKREASVLSIGGVVCGSSLLSGIVTISLLSMLLCLYAFFLYVKVSGMSWLTSEPHRMVNA